MDARLWRRAQRLAQRPALRDTHPARAPAPARQAYAMTEASHQMTSNPLPKNGAHRPGSVGKPQGSVQVRHSRA